MSALLYFLATDCEILAFLANFGLFAAAAINFFCFFDVLGIRNYCLKSKTLSIIPGPPLTDRFHQVVHGHGGRPPDGQCRVEDGGLGLDRLLPNPRQIPQGIREVICPIMDGGVRERLRLVISCPLELADGAQKIFLALVYPQAGE